MDKAYLMFTPANIRFKVLRVLDGGYDVELGDEELRGFDELLQAFPLADKQLEEVLARFPREHYRLFIKPAVFQLPKQRAESLIRMLEELVGVDLSQRAITVKYQGRLYVIGFEFPCG